MKIRSTALWGTIAIALFSISIFGGLWIYSSANGNDGLTFCANKKGKITVVGEGFKKSECKKKETEIAFGGTPGPKGDQGDQGSQGEKGDTGDKGDQGDQGPQGNDGSPGEDGADGEKGDKGDTGDQGDTGSAGEGGGDLHLFDNNDQDLGMLIGVDFVETISGSRYLTFLPDQDIFLFFSRSGEIGNRFIAVFFEAENCVGTPLAKNINILNQQMYTGGPDVAHRIKYPGGDPLEDINILSSNATSTENPVCTNASQGPRNDLVVMDEVVLPFTEPAVKPFTIENK